MAKLARPAHHPVSQICRKIYVNRAYLGAYLRKHLITGIK